MRRWGRIAGKYGKSKPQAKYNIIQTSTDVVLIIG